MHGEAKHLKYHTEFAVKMGVKPQNILLPHVGTVVEVTKDTMTALQDIKAGEKIIDGKMIVDADNSVIKDRMQLSQEGVCIVTLGVNLKTGQLVKGPEITPCGVVYPDDMFEIIKEAKQSVISAINSTGVEKVNWEEMKAIIKRVLTNFFYKHTKHKPIIIPIMLEM